MHFPVINSRLEVVLTKVDELQENQSVISASAPNQVMHVEPSAMTPHFDVERRMETLESQVKYLTVCFISEFKCWIMMNLSF